jgi:hypothetical protein
MIATYHLWQALHHPPSEHPIHRRVADVAFEPHAITQFLYRMLTEGQMWLWPLLFVLDVRLILLVLLSGTLCGAIWTMRVQGWIRSERTQRTYDLLCLSPIGSFGTVWAICTGCLHRNQSFRTISSGEAWYVRLALYLLVAFATYHLIDRLDMSRETVTLSWLVAIVVILSVDYVQSILLGSLIGIYSAHRQTDDAYLFGLSMFLVVQVVTFAGAILGAMGTGYLLGRLGVDDSLMPIVMGITVFSASREIILRWIYTRLQDQLNADPATPL